MAITLLSYKSLYYYSRNNIEKVIIIKKKSVKCESLKIDHHNLGQGGGGGGNGKHSPLFLTLTAF